MDCVKWLREYLKREGSALCDKVKEKAMEAGYSQKDLKSARKELGVKTHHQFDDDGATENWFWYLEEQNAGK